MKRRLIVGLTGALILLTFSLSGCGGGTTGEEEVAAEEPEITAAEEEVAPDEAMEEVELLPDEEEESEDTAGLDMVEPENLEARVEREPAMAYLGMSIDEVESSYGSPSMEGDWRGAYFLSYDQDDMLFWFDSEIEKVIGVGFLNYHEPGREHVLGLERRITFAGIRDQLGEPSYEGVDESEEIGGYLFVYETDKHVITISSVDDTPGMAGYIEIITKLEWR